MNQHSKKSSNWLVRSSGRVLGPYSDSELEEKILKKEISIIDEISTPWQRWDFVREFPMFYDAVEKVRQSVSISEGSMTNIADELTKTGCKTPSQNESFSAQPTDFESKQNGKSLVHEKIKSVSTDNHDLQESKFLIFSKYFFAISLLAFSFFVIYKRYISHSSGIQQTTVKDFLNNDDKVTYYENLFSQKKIKYEQFHELILLKINNNENAANIKNMLDQAGILFPAIKNEDYQFLQGMLALEEKDYEQAESLFQNAISEEGKVNYLISLYGQKKFDFLIQQSKVQLKKFESLNIANQLLVLSLLSKNKLNELKQFVEQSRNQKYLILNELLMLAKGISKKSINEILKKDLIFHQRFESNINISNEWIETFFSQEVCDNLKVEIKELQLACYITANKRFESNKLLKELELAKPQSYIVQILSMYHDLLTNQEESAKIKAKVLPDQNSFLELYFKQELCFQSQDKNCFFRYQAKLLSLENRNEWKEYFEIKEKILNNLNFTVKETSFLPIRSLKVNR